MANVQLCCMSVAQAFFVLPGSWPTNSDGHHADRVPENQLWQPRLGLWLDCQHCASCRAPTLSWQGGQLLPVVVVGLPSLSGWASAPELASKEDLLEATVGVAMAAMAPGAICHDHWMHCFSEMAEEVPGDLQEQATAWSLNQWAIWQK